MTTTETGPFALIEVDRMTGNERRLDNMATDPWTRTWDTREEAEAEAERRRAIVVSRYGYRVTTAAAADADPSLWPWVAPVPCCIVSY